MAVIVSQGGFIEVGKGYKVPKSAQEKEEEAEVDQPEASLPPPQEKGEQRETERHPEGPTGGKEKGGEPDARQPCATQI